MKIPFFILAKLLFFGTASIIVNPRQLWALTFLYGIRYEIRKGLVVAMLKQAAVRKS